MLGACVRPDVEAIQGIEAGCRGLCEALGPRVGAVCECVSVPVLAPCVPV